MRKPHFMAFSMIIGWFWVQQYAQMELMMKRFKAHPLERLHQSIVEWKVDSF